MNDPGPPSDPQIDLITQKHEHAMGYLLARAHGLFRGHLDKALTGTGLHMGHVLILASLSTSNDLTQTQLTQLAGTEKSSLVLFLDALEKDGWVERRPHPTDRRAHQVHLTDDGRARFAVIGARLYALQERNLEVFSAEERAQFTQMLLRLNHYMDILD